MAYKLYINNKLFNGIGNNNYNKGTIAINGTIYQYDNSSSSVTQFNIYYHYLQPESQAVNTYTVNDGYTIDASDIPVMANTDYLLDGYYYDSSFTTPVTAGDIVDKDTDIYLNWISKTYLYNVSGVYNPNTVYNISLTNNDYYINDISYYDSNNAPTPNSTYVWNSISDDDELLQFNGYFGIRSLSGATSSATTISINDRHKDVMSISFKYSGKIKFYYYLNGSNSANGTYPSSPLSSPIGIGLGTISGNKLIDLDTYATENQFHDKTLYISKYFTVNSENDYGIYVCTGSSSSTSYRLYIAGFKFVAD